MSAMRVKITLWLQYDKTGMTRALRMKHHKSDIWVKQPACAIETSSLQESEELLGIPQAVRSVKCDIFNKYELSHSLMFRVCFGDKEQKILQALIAEGQKRTDSSLQLNIQILGGAEKHGVLMESPAQFMMGDSQSLLDMLTENYLKDSQIVRVMPHVLTPSSILVNTDPNHGIQDIRIDRHGGHDYLYNVSKRFI
ncbi:hypothetical protein Q7C36_009209 [Tachysurus vachellii]|uniref:Uncharacterized protein n=1 Tax=Tachysurus vachellii TaxID=175792 RepID=A0AA88SVV1_TACVA|nr:hypothetical protein Q7C36_009209 [Tachysurus vachellii]